MLQDYQIRTINSLRDMDNRFKTVTDGEIVTAYRVWSDIKASAGWLSQTERGLEEFTEWAFTPPIFYYGRR